MPFARRLTAIAVGYGIVAGLALFFLAPLVNLVIDESKLSETVDVVRWLAWIPLLKGLQYFPANALTGADHHNVRSKIIVTTALLNLGANIVLVPQFGWRAVAATTLVSETIFALLLWAAVVAISKREAEGVPR